MDLILQLSEQARFILNDVSTLFNGNSYGNSMNDVKSEEAVTTVRNDVGTGFASFIPPVELFGSISKISVEMYQKNNVCSANPILLLNIAQPSIALNTVDKVQCRLMIQDLDVFTAISDIETLLKDTPFPTENDYDKCIVKCKDAASYNSSEKLSLPAFLQVSVVLTEASNVDLNVFVGRTVQVELDAASVKNIARLSQMIPLNRECSPTVNEDPHPVEECGNNTPRLNHIDISTKSMQMSYTGMQEKFIVSAYCHGIEMKADFTYSNDIAREMASTIQTNGLRIRITDSKRKKMNLLSPMKMKVQILVEFLK